MGEARWSRRPDTSPPPFTLAVLNVTTISANMTSTSQLLGLAEEGLRCDQEIERRYEIVPSVVCSMCCLFGIIYCFFGKWPYSHLCCSWTDMSWYKYSCALSVAKKKLQKTGFCQKFEAAFMYFQNSDSGLEVTFKRTACCLCLPLTAEKSRIAALLVCAFFFAAFSRLSFQCKANSSPLA